MWTGSWSATQNRSLSLIFVVLALTDYLASSGATHMYRGCAFLQTCSIVARIACLHACMACSTTFIPALKLQHTTVYQTLV